jgi:hypothetical protein
VLVIDRDEHALEAGHAALDIPDRVARHDSVVLWSGR